MDHLLAWLNANGVAVQAAATVLLLGVTVTYVILTWKIARASRDQANLLAESSQRSLRAVAATLLEEVTRVRDELGPRPQQGVPPPLGGLVIPEVQPWLKPVLPQAASSNPAIVGLFGKLDRDLYNLGARVDELEKDRKKLEETKTTLEGFTRRYADQPATMEEVMPWQEAERAVHVADENVRNALDRASDAYIRCHNTLDELEKALGHVLSELK